MLYLESDKRYLLVHGAGATGTTSIFDPMGLNGNVAGPAVCGSAAIGAGTNAFLRPDRMTWGTGPSRSPEGVSP